MNLDRTTMYKAIQSMDSEFEGIFYTCVKTTGIFCKPSCKARKPKFENVEFVFEVTEAIKKGYRPCKLCKPLQTTKAVPASIAQLIDEIQKNPSAKITDYDLTRRSLEPNTIRRWFQKNYGITFHAFQRMSRINSAYKKIAAGSSVTKEAFESGYESLSGFNDSFKKYVGESPNKAIKEIIDFTRFETPLGTMFACATKKGLCLLEFSDRRMLETQLKTLKKRYNAVILQGRNSILDKTIKQIAEYFENSRDSFDVALDVRGTQFQEVVWKELQTIPFGETRSYQEQANNIGKPTAIRAVANANGQNRIAIIIPCHRVIGSDGSLTGYGGGVWRKEKLLQLERTK